MRKKGKSPQKRKQVEKWNGLNIWNLCDRNKWLLTYEEHLDWMFRWRFASVLGCDVTIANPKCSAKSKSSTIKYFNCVAEIRVPFTKITYLNLCRRVPFCCWYCCFWFHTIEYDLDRNETGLLNFRQSQSLMIFFRFSFCFENAMGLIVSLIQWTKNAISQRLHNPLWLHWALNENASAYRPDSMYQKRSLPIFMRSQWALAIYTLCYCSV